MVSFYCWSYSHTVSFTLRDSLQHGLVPAYLCICVHICSMDSMDIHFLSFPPFPSLPGAQPTNMARGSGERLSSPSGSGRSPAARRFLVHFRLKRTLLLITIMEEVSPQLHHRQTEYLPEIEHLVQHTHWPISHAAQSLLFHTCKRLAMATVLISLSTDNGATSVGRVTASAAVTVSIWVTVCKLTLQWQLPTWSNGKLNSSERQLTVFAIEVVNLLC